MDRSPGFASAACDSRALGGSLSLRLVSKLNLAARRDSLAHSTKGTPSPRKGAPTACGRTVSGAVSLPSRGAFHLSLTVLVRYRSRESVQPWRVVPPASRRVPRARRYSGSAPQPRALRVRGSHPVPPAFPGRSASAPLSDSAHGLRPVDWRSRNPHAATPSSYELAWVWAGPVSLAATPGISVDFSSSGYLDVSVPPVASSRPIGSGAGSQAWPWLGFPIREPPDRRPFAPPRGLSQLAAPFVDFLCQGIRRAPLTSSRTFSMGIHIETSRSF